MNKKDRIAIVLSIPVLLFGLSILPKTENGLIVLTPLFIYWSYRFIKGDISFIKKKDDL